MELHTQQQSASVKGRSLVEVYPDLAARGMADRMQGVLTDGIAQLLSPVFHHHFIPIQIRARGQEPVRWMVQYTRLLPVIQDEDTTGLLILIEDYTERVVFEEELKGRNAELEAGQQRLSLAMADLQRSHEEPRATQEGLVEGEKMKALVEIAGGLGHEMGQPLTMISGSLQMALQNINVGDGNHGNTLQASKAAARMAVMLEQIRAIRRYETAPYVGQSNIVNFDRSAERAGDDTRPEGQECGDGGVSE